MNMMAWLAMLKDKVLPRVKEHSEKGQFTSEQDVAPVTMTKIVQDCFSSTSPNFGDKFMWSASSLDPTVMEISM